MPDCSSSSHTNPVILQLLLPLPLLLLLLLLAPMVPGGRFSTVFQQQCCHTLRVRTVLPWHPRMRAWPSGRRMLLAPCRKPTDGMVTTQAQATTMPFTE